MLTTSVHATEADRTVKAPGNDSLSASEPELLNHLILRALRPQQARHQADLPNFKIPRSQALKLMAFNSPCRSSSISTKSQMWPEWLNAAHELNIPERSPYPIVQVTKFSPPITGDTENPGGPLAGDRPDPHYLDGDGWRCSGRIQKALRYG